MTDLNKTTKITTCRYSLFGGCHPFGADIKDLPPSQQKEIINEAADWCIPIPWATCASSLVPGGIAMDETGRALFCPQTFSPPIYACSMTITTLLCIAGLYAKHRRSKLIKASKELGATSPDSTVETDSRRPGTYSGNQYVPPRRIQPSYGTN